VNSYGGGAGTQASSGRSPICEAAASAPPSTASTYTPEEARMAEQYARDAMADAAASDDRHYRSH